MKHNFKKGDTVICIELDQLSQNKDQLKRAGAGYFPGKKFIIDTLEDFGGDDIILWPKGENGVRYFAVKHFEEDTNIYEIY